MRIIVPIKQVPASEELRYDPSSRTLMREGVTSVINAFDKRSLTEAMRLRGLYGGSITAITMGPPQARNALVECLGRGVDRCIHITGPEFAGSDTLATARTLAAAIRQLSYDLLLLGKWSTDSETGQVGPGLAEMLDLPQITGATAIELAGKVLLVTRETNLGFEQIECALPALLTSAEHLIKPVKTKPDVIATGMTRLEADPGLIEVLGAANIGLSPEQTGLTGSPTWVTALRPVEIEREHILLSGDAVSSAKSLLRQLEERGIGSPGKKQVRLPVPPLSPEGGKTIWAVAEWLPSPGGLPVLRQVSIELASEATRIAHLMAGRSTALVIGSNVRHLASELASYGPASILLADDARLKTFSVETYAWVLSRSIEKHKPWAVLFPATSFGQDLAPRVAARLGLGLTSDCLGLEIGHEGELLQLKPAFGGQVIAPIASRTSPTMTTLRPGMLALYAPDPTIVPQIMLLDLDGLPEPRAKVLSTSMEGTTGLTLDNARMIVCVGSGVGGPGALQQVEELAQALGSRLGFAPPEIAIGATRKVVDEGWLPRHQQIGITGRAVAPDLYIALGVKGTFNHTAGIIRSGTIVAINNDVGAPIFDAADIGIICDWQEFASALSFLL